MKTSMAIKAGQYQPAEVWRAENGDYAVMSRTREEPWTVTKDGNEFTCECPAHTGTCFHVSSVIVRSMRARGFSVVQVWRFEHEAKRQRRKTFAITRKSIHSYISHLPARKAWVTVGKRDWLVETNRLGRLWKKARFDFYNNFMDSKLRYAARDKMDRLMELIDVAQHMAITGKGPR